jgi:hypothetical protein
MEVPHYVYLMLKMLEVHGSFSRSDNCDKDFQKIASKFRVKEELNARDVLIDHKQPPTTY